MGFARRKFEAQYAAHIIWAGDCVNQYLLDKGIYADTGLTVQVL